MKKRLLVVLSALIIFGLAAVVFAYNRTAANNATENSATSCPMHKQMAGSVEHKDSCCGMADYCKDGKCQMGGDCCKSGNCCKDKDSCPMKKNTESKSNGEMNMSKVTVVGGEASGDSCCQPGADCCKGGACCHKKS